jgi:hypothetical protein
MTTAESLDLLFRDAVAAIDAGDVTALDRLLAAQPRLVRERLDAPGPWLRDTVGAALEGFFNRPYLLWFVAEDPVRHGTLPRNIAAVTRLIIDAARRESVATLQEQLDYALKLTAWSWIARQSEVQLALIDVLADAGAVLDGNPDSALVNGNVAAAAHLVERGAVLTLSTALCLERWDDATRLGTLATAPEKQFGLTLSALRGNARGVAAAIGLGADVNTPSVDLYSHGTPLHHAVHSASLEAVQVIVNAGATLDVKDSIYHGTPLEWAEFGKRAEIASYLRGKGAS